jgi:adenine-specific DNA-methyltransferase
LNYIGSKKSLLSFLEEALSKCEIDKSETPVLCDIFSGTGAVGRHFKGEFSIIANDMEAYSSALVSHYIGNHKELKIKKYIQTLNDLKGIETGFIFNNYCPSGKDSLVEKKTKEGIVELNRMYFSDENGKIIDEARQQIDIWLEEKEINKKQYDYLLAVILEASDKIANTASVYGAFLKKLKKTALNKIEFKELDYLTTDHSHKVYNEDANELVKKIKGNVLYLDPPYNQRQYGANYHILNTIAKYDNPEVRGVTGMRDYTPSKWCKVKEVEKEFEAMISNARFDYVLFSYSSESIMTQERIEEIMSKYGEYSFITKDYSRFKADKDSEDRNYKADSVIEYVHILKKK